MWCLAGHFLPGMHTADNWLFLHTLRSAAYSMIAQCLWKLFLATIIDAMSEGQDSISFQFQITTNMMQHFYSCSTCFRRFLRPSSGAHNCTYIFSYCQQILLLAAIVYEMELQFHLIHDSCLTIPEAVCTVMCS